MKAKSSFIDALDCPDWAQKEFAQAPLVDRRLNRRLSLLVADLARHPGAPLPQACETPAKRKGAYRFLDNAGVEPEQILAGHRQACGERREPEPLVLIPTDTTSFNFSGLVQTTDLGRLGSKNCPHQRGLWMHSTLAFTPTGLPLGILAVCFWSRPFSQPDPRTRHQKAFEEKESVHWRESWAAAQAVWDQLPTSPRWVQIDDREGDIYEVWAAALAHPRPRVELLISAHHNRPLVGTSQRLWTYLARLPKAGQLSVRVSGRESQPARMAQLELRFGAVQLRAPCRKAGQPALRLWAIEARERQAPAGGNPIRWRLLTTAPIRTLAQAQQRVRWYALRWAIEVFHKIVKSGCRIEAVQLGTGQGLERLLMMDLIVAWRIAVFTQVGRQNPAIAASDYFTEPEWKALYSYIYRTKDLPDQAPPLGEFMQWVGQLGGFVRSKANPYPGPLTIARGLSRLEDLAMMWAIDHDYV